MLNSNRRRIFLLVGLVTGLVVLAGGWALTHEGGHEDTW